MESDILDGFTYRDSIISLLQAEELPVSDLPETLQNFRVAIANEDIIGVAGLEVYGNFGLLRSLAVSPQYRGKGIANNLLTAIEDLGTSQNLTSIYLLTETAPDYFSRKGYQKITCDEVPAEVQASSEFSHVCPASAIVMKKDL